MSSYHDQIEAMISYKESLGYTRRTYACYLNDLDSYLTEAGVDEHLYQCTISCPGACKGALRNRKVTVEELPLQGSSQSIFMRWGSVMEFSLWIQSHV